MDEQLELASHLRSNGLEDTEYWLPQLDKKLDVKSKTDLDFLEGDMDSFTMLKEVTRCQAEVETLEKLFGGELCEREQIAWETLKGISNTLNDSMVLHTVSGGRALHGILLSKRYEDQLAMRDRLLEAPKEVHIAAESMSDTMHILQFSSQKQEDNFKKACDILGNSAVESANAPVYGKAISATTDPGRSASHRVEDDAMHEEYYLSTMKCSTVEVASYSFQNKDLKLSEDPKHDLHSVLKLLKHHGAEGSCVKEACERFFHTYGSHVSKGPLKFGGYFSLACSSRGFSHKETKAVKKMQSDVISATAGVSFAGFGVSAEVHIDKIIELYQIECSESTRASTRLQVRKTGGPLETTDFSSWKTGLVANSSTWILTDRGKKLVPVWDIITMNHNGEFGEITDVLQNTWGEMSGLKAKHILSVKLLHDSEAVLKKINGWKMRLTRQQIEDFFEIEGILAYLSRMKNDILDEAGNPRIWIGEYLSDPNVQKFLVTVVDSALIESEAIKVQIQRLAKPEELKHFDTSSFPGIEQVFKSLYSYQPPKSTSLPKDIPDFQSLDKFLEETLDEAWLAQLSSISRESQVTIAADVSKAIVLLRSHYEHTYDDVLVTILVHPFQSGNCDDVITLNPITLKDLESLCKYFSEQRKLFDQCVAKKCPLHLQVYLFELAIKLSGEAEQSELLQLIQQSAQMMRLLQPPLDKELDGCLDHISSLAVFREFLQYLMTKPLSSQLSRPEKVSSSSSLCEALETKAREHRVLYNDHSSLLEKNPTVHSLFMKIGLDNFYPKKLQLKDALCIRQDPLHHSLKETQPTDPKELPYLVLHKLMAYDVHCRSNLMPHSSKDIDDHDDYADHDEDGGMKYVDSNDGIHPIDSLLALILCSDDFLRQDLFSRLAKCQLSVPFILPDPFTKKLTIPLWAMRSIIKEWKCTKSSGEVIEQTDPIVSYPTPIVSFICFRKQKNGKSKSVILNEVISESHSHFFHRDCPGGHYKSLLGEGLVDMCWYLPAGQAADVFPDAVTFLNLHGDARQHPQQIKFLSQISFACVVLLNEEVTESDRKIMEILKMFSSCPGGVILLDSIGKNPKSVKEEIPDVHAINMTMKNASEVKLSIQKQIKRKLSNMKQFQTLEDCCNIKRGEIYLDEDSYCHREGLNLANQIKNIITGDEAGTKETMLPLQGKDLWQAWAAKDRELYRQTNIGNKTVSMYTEDIKAKKKLIRDDQMKHVEKLPSVTKSFIVSLLELGGPSNAIMRNYFLQHLKLKLDNLSRKNISGMLHEYQAILREVTKLQDKSVSQAPEVETKIKQHRDRMKALQDDIINASIGLEHLFREIGQVYEAVAQSHDYDSELSRLPKAAAELLIEGYPLELMDGDAAHVPLKWVAAVFKEAIEMLKKPKNLKTDPKVLVLSVLGLQSTGKSTMLNTVFGLQFNVSAGRCTRGAFLQMLPLDENLRTQTECEYMFWLSTLKDCVLLNSTP